MLREGSGKAPGKLPEGSGCSRKAPGDSGMLRDAPGRLREGFRRLPEGSEGFKKAPGCSRKAPGCSGKAPGRLIGRFLIDFKLQKCSEKDFFGPG